LANMSLGRVVRTLLGDRLSRSVGHGYRRIFVDLAQVSAVIAAAIPARGHVLDVGGGDGEPLNFLLHLRPDIRVTTIDPGERVGQWIVPCHDTRVVRLPRTSLQQYLASNRPAPDVVLLSDVVHHVPPNARAALFAAIGAMLRKYPGIRLIVKDVEPGHWRARLGYLSDRYVTGDRHVQPVSRSEICALASACGPLDCRDTGLSAVDPPNYVLVFSRADASVSGRSEALT
jgi:Methyltransferase domain